MTKTVSYVVDIGSFVVMYIILDLNFWVAFFVSWALGWAARKYMVAESSP